MKLEDQVCSLELAKKLKELGVKQESFSYWLIPNHLPHDWKLVPWCKGMENKKPNEIYSAFSVAELGEILPIGFKSGSNNHDDWFCAVYGKPLAYSITEADARAKMLVYLIEQNLVKP